MQIKNSCEMDWSGPHHNTGSHPSATRDGGSEDEGGGLGGHGHGGHGGSTRGGESAGDADAGTKTNQVTLPLPTRNDSTPVPPSANKSMPQAYFQCRSARDASFQDKAVEISARNTLGIIEGGEENRIGSFDSQDGSYEMSFAGSRVLKGGTAVNQNLSASFDPATLICVSCKVEHPVITSSGPICVCVSDQNFVSNMSGGEGWCIAIIRIESASLEELVDMTFEIFENQKFPGGTVFCIGSASHLHREGVTTYTQDWGRCVDRLTRTLSGVQVCPLIPILTGTCPGSLSNDLVALASWYAKIYDGQILGLLDSWIKLAMALSEHTTLNDGVRTYHSAALPESLARGAPLKNHRFLSTGSRRVNNSGFDAKTADELLCALLTSLSSALGISCSPNGNIVRTPEKRRDTKENIEHLVVIGCSHMRRVSVYLREAGYRVTECTLPGSIPDNAAIANLITQLPNAIEPGTAIIFDLFGNFSYRFEQADGSMALPILLGGRYHLLGNVGVCTDASFRALVANTVPLFAVSPGTPKVILPTIPRYIGGGCCGSSGHGDNAGSDTHTREMTDKVAHLRKILRTELSKTTLESYWIPDVLTGLLPGSEGGETPLKDSAAELGSLFSCDNVHLTPNGYARLRDTIVAGIAEAVKKAAQGECQIIGEKLSFYWRGFKSPRGSAKRVDNANAYNHRVGKTGDGAGTGRGNFRGRRMGRGGGRGPFRGHFAPY